MAIYGMIFVSELAECYKGVVFEVQKAAAEYIRGTRCACLES